MYENLFWDVYCMIFVKKKLLNVNVIVNVIDVVLCDCICVCVV